MRQWIATHHRALVLLHLRQVALPLTVCWKGSSAHVEQSRERLAHAWCSHFERAIFDSRAQAWTMRQWIAAHRMQWMWIRKKCHRLLMLDRSDLRTQLLRLTASSRRKSRSGALLR